MDYQLLDTQNTLAANLAASPVTVVDYTSSLQSRRVVVVLDVGGDVSNQLDDAGENYLSFVSTVSGRLRSATTGTVSVAVTKMRIQTVEILLEIDEQLLLTVQSDNLNDISVDMSARIYNAGIGDGIVAAIRPGKIFSARIG